MCGGPHESLDITDHAAVRTLVRRVRPDACVHLAAISAVPAARQDPALAWNVNLHGSLALAGALLETVPECRLIYVSSADIYGRSFLSGLPLDEMAAPAPMNTYAATKAATDLALGAMVGEGLLVVRLRPFNHTGPGQSTVFVVPAIARQVARIAAGLQKPVLELGALDPVRDFLDVRDVCDAYVACLAHPAIPPGTILNIASGQPRRDRRHRAGIAGFGGGERRRWRPGRRCCGRARNTLGVRQCGSGAAVAGVGSRPCHGSRPCGTMLAADGGSVVLF